MDDSIDRFINERILVAGELIAKHGNSKIHDGDVILTYARYIHIDIRRELKIDLMLLK